VVARFIHRLLPHIAAASCSKRAKRAIALVDRDPNFHTDRMTSALVEFWFHRHLAFKYLRSACLTSGCQICGTNGRH